MAKIKVTNPKYVIDAHLKTNYFKLRNTGGPKGDKGDKGDTGATGPEGPQGATGATGRAATVAIGTTQTLNPGQSAFVNNVGTNNDAIFNFGIPQGDKGDKGDTGATGATGQAATVAVGTTTTLAAGSDATVTNSGSTSSAVLNFGIPKGDKGDTGEKGDTGGVRSEYVTELPASGQENTYYLTGDTATIGTASGESFQVTNNDNTGQVLLDQLKGNAEQTTYSGKNLFDMDAFLTAGGATYTKNGNVFSLTDMGNLYAAPQPLNLTNGVTYTFSQVLQTQSSTNVRFDILKDNALYASCYADQPNNLVKTFTADSSTYTIRLNYSTRVYPVLFNSPMLEKSATATAYEPYVGGTASPNPDYPQAVNTVTGEQEVDICGKNLFYEMHDNFGINGNTGEIMQLANRYARVARVKAGQTYSTSRSAVGDSSYFWVGFFATKPEIGLSSITFSDMGPSVLTKTITAPAGANYCAVFYGAGTSPDSQLELGSTATAYEPYQSQSYEINLGKNLMELPDSTRTSADVDWEIDGEVITVAGTTSRASYSENESITGGLATAGNYPPYATLSDTNSFVVPAGTYTLSATIIKAGNTACGLSFGVGASGSMNSNSQKLEVGISAATGTYKRSYTMTVGEGQRVYISVWYEGSSTNKNVDFTINDIQLERGSQATDYQEYFTPIELCKIGTYQDYIWNDDGVWKIHKEVGKRTLDSTFGTYDSSIPRINSTSPWDIKGSTSSEQILAISNKFVPETFTEAYTNKQNGFAVSGANYVMFVNSAWTTAEIARAAIDGTVVYYALATPTDTEITDDTLLAQLNTISELYQGVNNITIVPSAGALGTITVKYTTWDKNNRYDVYIWNDTIGDFQIIHSGGGNN